MIYENIKELADKKGLSIKELERQAGLANASISKWKHASPTVVNLQSVAKVLGVTVNRLLRE